jgi:hypothetical protein
MRNMAVIATPIFDLDGFMSFEMDYKNTWGGYTRRQSYNMLLDGTGEIIDQSFCLSDDQHQIIAKLTNQTQITQLKYILENYGDELRLSITEGYYSVNVASFDVDTIGDVTIKFRIIENLRA